MNDFFNYILSGVYALLFGVGKWYFTALDKKLIQNTKDIEDLKKQLALNDQNDVIVRQSIEEIKASSAATQQMITEFLTKYSFVLDKLVDHEKKK